jgi:SAM-dependent methyltransferase
MSNLQRDRHALYELAVQGVEYDVEFLARLYRKRHGKDARTFREDFCSTAGLAVAWAQLHPANRAIAVDLDPEPLAWARKRRLPFVGEAAERVTLVLDDVRHVQKPRVDVACALNFSWWIFHERKQLLAYLKAARAGLKPGGILMMDIFGGVLSETIIRERSKKRSGKAPDGVRMPPFTYIWEHKKLNALDRRLLAHIHFELQDGSKIDRAFTYDWRMWTIPELRELAAEAGFGDFEIYSEGWNQKTGKPSGVMQKRTHIDHSDSWIATCVLHN